MEYHQKAGRLASQCVYCIRQSKRAYRKAMRKKNKRLITQENQMDCSIYGNLTQDTVDQFSIIFAEFLKGA
jgi:hypothetical protein